MSAHITCLPIVLTINSDSDELQRLIWCEVWISDPAYLTISEDLFLLLHSVQTMLVFLFLVLNSPQTASLTLKAHEPDTKPRFNT